MNRGAGVMMNRGTGGHEYRGTGVQVASRWRAGVQGYTGTGGVYRKGVGGGSMMNRGAGGQ